MSVTISPTTAQPFLGQTQQFDATVTGSTNTAVTWSVNGITGGNASLGIISTTGLYTAPQNLPSPATVSVTATSQADPIKTATAQVTVRSDLVVGVTPSTLNVELGTTAPALTATVTGTGSFNTGVTWSVNGVVGGSTTFGTVATNGAYTAPRILPVAPAVTITATSIADNSKSAAATATVTSNFSFSVSGPASLVNGASGQFTATVTPVPGSSPDPGATWSVSGAGCTGAACGIIDPTGLYTAPNVPPSPATVRVTGTSVADPSKGAFRDVTIQSQLAVFISPTAATLSASGTQQFVVNVVGTANTSVTWSVSGASCSGITCGVVDSNGLYAAPNVAPSPNNQVNVTATSVADPSKSATATVTISGTGPAITRILPASIIAGPVSGFTFKVQGTNFVSGSGGGGSTIVFRGSNRLTTCTSPGECTIFLDAVDVASPDNIPVQVRNPDGSMSNQVVFMAVAPATTQDIVTLTGSSPAATGKDIIVVEPTSAGSTFSQINIQQVGIFSANTCNARGSSVSLTRPAAGTQNVEICLVGVGLGAIYTYTISGPDPNDISILSVSDSGLGVRITLTLSSTTQLGPRTIFVENANKEKSAATGALEVRAP